MTDAKLQEYMDQTVVSFSAAQNEIADALYRIFCELYGDGSAQRVQLLALRRYIEKGGPAVAAAWPWNDEAKTRHRSDTKAMNDAADKVITKFAVQNPGLTLGRSHFRDLPRQVHLWCKNETVFRASAQLLTLTLRELAKPEYPEIPTDNAPIKKFKGFLDGYRPTIAVTSAAPGTSDHGQDRAVDFVVIKDGKTIAGTRGASEIINRDWVATGYDKALKSATKDTGLDGPLRPPRPNEPWHYWLASASTLTAE